MQSVNLALELLSLAISGIFCGSDLFRRENKNRQSALVLYLVITNASVLLSLIARSVIDGNKELIALNYIVNIVGITAGCVFSFMFARHVALLLNDCRAVSGKVFLYLQISCLIILLLILLSPLSELIFYVDDAGYYHNNGLREVRFAIQALITVTTTALLIPRLKVTDRNTVIVIFSYGVLMVVGSVLESCIPGLILSGVTRTVMLTVVFFLHQTKLMSMIVSQREELSEKRVAIMVSQIQPHFLYNAMTTIRYFCRVDPMRAAELIDDFSRYIRDNMDSLTKTSPVLLQQEIAHIRIYMKIEQCRFPGVRAEYAIRDDLFFIPSLSVQPLVENAVKYGMSRDRHTLRVRISSWTDAGGHHVSVEDDGVGFDTSQPSAPGRSHIGIANARARIEKMVGGRLEIISQPGEGTTALITIPFKGGKKDEGSLHRRRAERAQRQPEGADSHSGDHGYPMF